jgi:hypothetical protein
MTSKPASTNRNKTKSEIITGMKVIKLGSVTVSQARCAGTQTERSYRWGKPKETMIRKELAVHPYNICAQPMFV